MTTINLVDHSYSNFLDYLMASLQRNNLLHTYFRLSFASSPDHLRSKEVSLYSKPLFILIGFRCFTYVELAKYLLVWLNPNQSKQEVSRTGLLPRWWVFSVRSHSGLIAYVKLGTCIEVIYFSYINFTYKLFEISFF